MRFRGWVVGFVAVSVFADAGAADRAILTTSDYSSGSLAVLDLEMNEATVNVLNIHSDASVLTYRGKVYVINRLDQDNILVLDPDDLSTPLLQFSVGNGTNPQDIAFVSETKAYVARRASERVLVVDPATGDSLGSIDLSFVADADGLPEVKFVAIFDGRLYVTCQRLDRNNESAPTDRSEVVVVDVDTDTPLDLDATQDGVQGIVLQAKNPFGGQVRIGVRLFVSCIGTFGDQTDGGIEVLDLQNNRTEGILLSEAELGGNVGAVAMLSQDRGYVVVSDTSFVNSVKGFTLAAEGVSAHVSEALPGASGGFTPTIAALKGWLYVSDQGSFTDPVTAGLRIYDTAADTLLAGPISTGLPPNSIAFSEDVTVADFNGDGDVDFDDFVLFAHAFGAKPGVANWDVKFDLEADGEVNFKDFVTFARLFGT